MNRALMLVWLVFVPSTGQAYCIQSSGYDFSSSVSGAIDWLVCLHNEQKDALNSHADSLNSQADGIQRLTRTVNENALITDTHTRQINDLRTTLSDIALEAASLQNELDRVSSESVALIGRVQELEKIVLELKQ